jgi:hypothetical protein
VSISPNVTCVNSRNATRLDEYSVEGYRVSYAGTYRCSCQGWARAGSCAHIAAVRHHRNETTPRRLKLRAIIVKPAPRLTVELDAQALERACREHEARNRAWDQIYGREQLAAE